MGPKRSAWIHVFGVSGIGSGANNWFLFLPVFLCWQRKHIWVCFSTWEYTVGQKYEVVNFRYDFRAALCPVKMLSWVSHKASLRYLSGSHSAVHGYLWSSSLIQASLFLSKKTLGASDSQFLMVCLESDFGHSLFLRNWKIACKSWSCLWSSCRSGVKGSKAAIIGCSMTLQVVTKAWTDNQQAWLCLSCTGQQNRAPEEQFEGD